LKPGAAFSTRQLEADRKALLALGWFRSVTATPETEGSKTTVTFRLVEWPRVTHIRVLGNTVLDRAPIVEAISTRVGQILRPATLREDIAAIERLYRERGFVGQVADTLLGEAAESGILRFEVLEVAIADVRVEGGTAALRKQAKAELREAPPKLYRPEALVNDQRSLLKLRGVKDATAKVETISPGRIRIIWRLNQPPDAPKPPDPAPANPKPAIMGG
jgi:outer membrane protein assembly factor BamA